MAGAGLMSSPTGPTGTLIPIECFIRNYWGKPLQLETPPKAALQTILVLGSTPQPQGWPFEAVAREVLSCRTAEEALQAVHAARPELVVVHETFPRNAALAFLQDIHRTASAPPVVVLAERPDVDEAILFVRHGAMDYVTANPTRATLERILRAARRPPEPEAHTKYFTPECPPGVPMVGRSKGMRKALKTITLVAESGCNPALVIGETGTGKELAARAIHAIRGGSNDNFVAVNCAALNANLLESELFGHVKGAFTGADGPKKGLFELAGTGSIFLDEVSEMPVELQAKLLRVLQERTFRRVGGTKTIPCRASILASSNRDLAAEVRAGRFRRDLYYRLAVFPIELPPLRDPRRRDDVPLLAEYFIKMCALPRKRPVRGLTEKARARLLAHDWPGNVRELRNVVERALIMETGHQIQPESLIIDGQNPSTDAESNGDHGQSALPVPENDFSLQTAERLFITRALRETGWQRTRAAALLGISRATLHAKLKRYKIRIPDESDAPASPTAASDVPSARSYRLSNMTV